MTTEPTPIERARPMSRRILIALLVATVVLATAGLLVAIRIAAPATDHAVSRVPRNATFYLHAFLKPSTQQRKALRDFLEGLSATDTEREAEETITEIVNRLLQDTGLEFEGDVEPWLGTELALFATQGEVDASAALIATDDEDAAGNAIERAFRARDIRVVETRDRSGVPVNSFSDGTVMAIDDGFVALGDEDAVVDWVSTDGDASLGEKDSYKDAIVNVPDHRLGHLYFDLAGAAEAELAREPGADDQLAAGMRFVGLGEEQPLVASVKVEPDSVVLDVEHGRVDGPSLLGEVPPEVFERVPEGATGAFAFPSFGDVLEGALQDSELLFGTDLEFFASELARSTGIDVSSDVLPWLGDAVLFVQGGTIFDLDGGLTLETTDAETSAETVESVRQYLAGLRPDDVYPGPESAPVGFGFQPIQFPQRVNVAATDDRVVIAYGNGATLDALETQTSPVAGRISDLLGDGFAPRAFVDVEKLRGFTQLVSGELTGAARVMADLGVVALGTKTSDERVSHRLVVTAPGPRDED